MASLHDGSAQSIKSECPMTSVSFFAKSANPLLPPELIQKSDWAERQSSRLESHVAFAGIPTEK